MLAEAFMTAVMAMTQPGFSTTIGPEVTGRPFKITARDGDPMPTDRYGMAARYSRGTYATTRCEIIIDMNVIPTLPVTPQETRAFVAAHELFHCMDEYKAPDGVDPIQWREAFADIGAAIFVKAALRTNVRRLLQARALKPVASDIDEIANAAVRDNPVLDAGAAVHYACVVRNLLFTGNADPEFCGRKDEPKVTK